MLKRFLVLSTIALLFAPALFAAGRDEDIGRARTAARVFTEIMQAPDGGIPLNLLQKAKCVVIIPGDVKFAFLFGGNYGRGVASCRTRHGWSAPLFVAMGGGSIGYQIGGSSTDLVLLLMNSHALQSLLSDNFKLGANAAVAAGPVGRKASAATDLKLNAEILSYSRSKGVFAGVSLNGSVIKIDRDANDAVYGPNADQHKILDGSEHAPARVRVLATDLHKYAG